jgi:hypothetical protein
MAAVQDDSLAPLRGADAVMGACRCRHVPRVPDVCCVVSRLPVPRHAEPDVLTKLGLFIAQGGAPKVRPAARLLSVSNALPSENGRRGAWPGVS